MLGLDSHAVAPGSVDDDLTPSVPESLLQELFAAQVSVRPRQPALISGDKALTYDELSRLSRRWGRRLRELGARPNTLIAVVMEKGWEQVLAVLGIVEAGAAYLPIDVELPAARLRHLVENGEVAIVLTQSRVDERLEWPHGIRRLCVDQEDLDGVSDGPLPPAQTPDDLAYVIYTSGSTGSPKGVMIAQRGVVNSVLRTNRRFGIGPADRALAVTALHHDMSVYDIFGLLAAGGTIVMPEAARRRDAAHWAELMRREQVTVWNSVPAMMEMLLEHVSSRGESLPASLRLAFLGGDWIQVTLPGRLQAQVAGVQVVSVGGPTETTLWNIWYPIAEVDAGWKSIPYGRPIAGNRYYVMDDRLAECLAGESGEMCCAGVGLALGYWRDAVQTRAKFVTHPRTGERIYRTGDFGRLLPDGNLEFLGRQDFQVKINGQRIELGEIESALRQHRGVCAAIVTAVEAGGAGKRLAAYIVPQLGTEPTAQGLRHFLSEKLPSHMIPVAFVLLDQFPLTANGKVDRRALPAPVEVRRVAEAPYVAPATEMERALTAIWQEVLGVERVGMLDNFFDLGAHSLHIVQAHSKLQVAIERELGVVAFFQYPSVSSLARHLAPAPGAGHPFREIQAQAARQREALARRQQQVTGKVSE